MSQTIIDTLWLIDLDDTLVKTRSMHELLLRLCSPAERKRLVAHNEARLAKRKIGITILYEPTKQLSNPAETMAQFTTTCAKNEQYVYPDGMRFLQHCRADETLIFSFGSPAYQQAKYQTLQTPIPLLTLDSPDKTAFLAKCFHGGTYHIGGFMARSIVLVDDRPYSFSGFDRLPHAKGILLSRAEFAHASAREYHNETAEMPSSVIDIASLDEIHQ